MCSIKKAALKTFALIAGKHLCGSLFLKSLIFSTLLKRDSNAKFLRPSILKNICERLLLKIYPVLLF